MGSAPSVLSMVRVTSARPSGGREEVPAKTTSSILPPRRLFTPCSPITQANASTMFDLPDPFGPTTQVIPGSNRSKVVEAKDLNPRRVRLFTYTRGFSSLRSWPGSAAAPGPGGAVPGLTPRPRRSRRQAVSGTNRHGPAQDRKRLAGWLLRTLSRVDDAPADSRVVGRPCRAAGRGNRPAGRP